MFDLINRKVFIARSGDSEKIMEANHKKDATEIEKRTLADEQMETLIKAFEEGLQEPPSNDELVKSMEDEQKAVMELARWLDQI